MPLDPLSDRQLTHIIVGGGSAGCTLAARLSEDGRNTVLLIEAGDDFPAHATPRDIQDTYAGRAFNNPAYFWPDLDMQRSSTEPGAPVTTTHYEQARVMGGGSSINGQVALRGAPRDYDQWHAMGASGWDWNGVLPYFRKLETDLDFTDQLHGHAGPIPIRRIPKEQWDDFTLAVADVWAADGYAARTDMNGTFEQGYAAIPLANDGQRRVSTATGYLDADVRKRPNLTIRANTEVRRLVLDGARVRGVEIAGDQGPAVIAGDRIILCAGAVHSPWLLLRSGIGPAEHLRTCGIEPLLDRPGVGSNLQDHPSISISAYLPASVRRRPAMRHNYANLVFSSGVAGCPPADMVMMVVCKSAWHKLGERLGTLSTYVGKAFSTGSVRLSAQDPDGPPRVQFDWLSDPRDMTRLVKSFRYMATILVTGGVPSTALDPFTVGFSPKVKKMGRQTYRNVVLTNLAAAIMDSSAILRRAFIRFFITGGLSLEFLLRDERALEDYIRRAVTGIWHPCGTCKMGHADDPMSVVDAGGQVIGLDNLFVADASIMPEIPTTNLNVPTIMVAERMADILKREIQLADAF